RAVEILLLFLPSRLARMFLQRRQDCWLTGAVKNNQQVLVENRARSVSPLVQHWPQIPVPQQRAVQIVGNDTSRGEISVDRLAVRYRGSGTGRILGVSSFGCR